MMKTKALIFLDTGDFATAPGPLLECVERSGGDQRQHLTVCATGHVFNLFSGTDTIDNLQGSCEGRRWQVRLPSCEMINMDYSAFKGPLNGITRVATGTMHMSVWSTMVQSKMECPICFFCDHTYFDTVFKEFGISLAYWCMVQRSFGGIHKSPCW